MPDHACRYCVDEQSTRLYDALPCGVMHCCAHGSGKTLFVNRAASAILGYEDFPDLLARRGGEALAHIPIGERAQAKRCIEKLLSGERSSCEFHHRIVRGDGAPGWIRGTAVLVESGDCAIIQAAFNDVTDLHERRYERDRNRYAEVLRTAFDEVHELNMHGGYVRRLSSTTREDHANPQMTLEEVHRIWERYVPRPRDRESVIDAARSLSEGSASSAIVTYRVAMGTGTRWCQSTFLRMGEDGILCCNQDVTERMRTEDEAVSRNLGDIVSRLPVGIGMFALRDGKAIPRYVSDPVCTMFGYTRDEFEKHWGNEPLFDADPLAFEDDAPSAQNESPRAAANLDIVLQRKDGTPLALRLRGTKFRTRSGEDQLFVAIADVTEELRAQHARDWQNERYRILSELTHAISFDYNSETDEALLYTDAGDGFKAQSIPRYLENLDLARDGVIHPDSLDAVRALFDAPEKRRTAMLEYRANYRGDGYRGYRANLYRMEDFDGAWHFIGLMEDIQHERDLKTRAENDQLTGVSNHMTTKQLVDEALADPSLARRCVCALVDVDDFKSVNDHCGHIKGDELLERIGSLMRRSCRPTDVVGRVGGDEFAILFKDMPLSMVLNRLDAIRAQVLELTASTAAEAGASVSIGVYAVEGASSYDEAFAKADEALYASKGKGKNRISQYASQA